MDKLTARYYAPNQGFRWREAMDLRLTVRTTVALMLALFMTNGHADIKRTAAGHPDLTGTYNVATLTPLQRPKRYGDN